MQDIQLLLAAQCHLGTKNCDFQMERYVYKRRNDGIYIIDLGKTWEKLQLAARVIVAIENAGDIVVQSARPYGQRAILKFAQYTGAKALTGRHTPGEPPLLQCMQFWRCEAVQPATGHCGNTKGAYLVVGEEAPHLSDMQSAIKQPGSDNAFDQLMCSFMQWPAVCTGSSLPHLL